MKKILTVMTRAFLAFVFLAYQVTGLNAQDIIVKKTGDDIRSKVTELNDAEVKYLKFGNPSGPVYSISIADIFMIKYENGSKDIFEKNPATGKIQIRHVDPPKQPVQPKQPEQAKQPVPPKQPEQPKQPEPTKQPEPAKQPVQAKQPDVKQPEVAEKKPVQTQPEPFDASTGEHDIVDLIEKGIVEAEVRGNDITNVNLSIRKLVPYPVNIRIPAGSFFVSENPSAQNMVATAAKKTRLTTNSRQNIAIPAACANRPKDIPDGNDKFTVIRSPNQAELALLMPALNKANAGTLTKQAAVWIVTDNADYSDLGSLVEMSGARAIGIETTARAMKICAAAGIDITSKRIWRDKATILEKLPAGELKNWLAKPAADVKPGPDYIATVKFEQKTLTLYVGEIAKDDDGNTTVELVGMGDIVLIRNGKITLPAIMEIVVGGKTVGYESCMTGNKSKFIFATKAAPEKIIVYGNDGKDTTGVTFDGKTKKVIIKQ
jgi:hypothetical protein